MIIMTMRIDSNSFEVLGDCVIVGKQPYDMQISFDGNLNGIYSVSGGVPYNSTLGRRGFFAASPEFLGVYRIVVQDNGLDFQLLKAQPTGRLPGVSVLTGNELFNERIIGATLASKSDGGFQSFTKYTKTTPVSAFTSFLADNFPVATAIASFVIVFVASARTGFRIPVSGAIANPVIAFGNNIFSGLVSGNITITPSVMAYASTGLSSATLASGLILYSFSDSVANAGYAKLDWGFSPTYFTLVTQGSFGTGVSLQEVAPAITELDSGYEFPVSSWAPDSFVAAGIRRTANVTALQNAWIMAEQSAIAGRRKRGVGVTPQEQSWIDQANAALNRYYSAAEQNWQVSAVEGTTARPIDGISAFAQKGVDNSFVISTYNTSAGITIAEWKDNAAIEMMSADDFSDMLFQNQQKYAAGAAIAYGDGWLYLNCNGTLCRVGLTDLVLPSIPSYSFQRARQTFFTLASATGGTAPYTYRLLRRGVTWTPPDGLTFNPTTRQFGGTATNLAPLGRYDVQLEVTDANGAKQTSDFSVFVTDAQPFLEPVALPTFVVGTRYASRDLGEIQGVSSVAAATYSYSLSGIDRGLPPGLAGLTGTRLNAWTPTREGRYRVRYRASSQSFTDAEIELQFRVILPAAANRPPVIGDIQPQVLLWGQRLSFNAQAVVSDPDGDPVTITYLNLPRGVQRTGFGNLLGIPQESGTFTVTIIANDGRVAPEDVPSRTFQIVVGSQPTPETPVSAFLQTIQDQTWKVGEQITAVVLEPLVNRPDGTTYTYNLTQEGRNNLQRIGGMSFRAGTDTTNGSITGTPRLFLEEPLTITYTATRATGTGGERQYDTSFQVTVLAEDAPPLVYNPTLSQPDFRYQVGQAIPARLPLESVAGEDPSLTYTYAVTGLEDSPFQYSPFGTHELVRVGSAVTFPSIVTYDAELIATAPGSRVSDTFQIVVSARPAPPQEVSQSSLDQQDYTFTVGDTVSETLAVVMNPPSGATYTYSTIGSAPPGLRISSIGITGNASSPGTWVLTRRATLATGEDTNAPLEDSFSIRVRRPAGVPAIDLVVRGKNPSGEFDSAGRPIYYLTPGEDVTLGYNFSNLGVRRANYPLRIFVASQGLSSGQAGYVSARTGFFNNQNSSARTLNEYQNLTYRAGFDGNPTSGTENDIVTVGRRRTWRGRYLLLANNQYRSLLVEWNDRVTVPPALLRVGANGTVPTSASVVYSARLERDTGPYFDGIQFRRQVNTVANQGAAVNDGQPVNITALAPTSFRRTVSPNTAANRTLATSEIRVIWTTQPDIPLRWERQQTSVTAIPNAGGDNEMPFVVGATGGVAPVTVRVFANNKDGLPEQDVSIRAAQFVDSSGDRAEVSRRREWGYYTFTAYAFDSSSPPQFIWKIFHVVVRPIT